MSGDDVWDVEGLAAVVGATRVRLEKSVWSARKRVELGFPAPKWPPLPDDPGVSSREWVWSRDREDVQAWVALRQRRSAEREGDARAVLDAGIVAAYSGPGDPPLAVVAAEFNVSSWRVLEALKRAGVPRRPPGARPRKS